ncbi:SDR family oxidoreductase [Bacillus sp. FJAT-42376]|uniref:SDR family oxidoreductase n=1 Tax=Bacillus sp. FJAT-42376 TaxID=2014076 RepID=UPI000F4FAF65|nr:SDR family NAD(P)-dependent oxidoreductase [Bacillus sp. FJAT-42376]AZB43425.1 SDR family oxidoreductase [Bacillus sp. FJAT-42376]
MTNSSVKNTKVAIVSGGGSGIGKAAALKFAREGIRVCILDLDKERALEVKNEINRFGGEAIAIETDMANEEMVKSAIQEVEDHWGNLDIIFNNAGINGVFSSIEEMETEDWDKTIHTNLRSTFLFVKYSIPLLKENGGSIVITSSINGNRIYKNFGMSAYSTTKAAQVAFMKMAALELAQFKIRVNAICPGAIDTNIDSSTEKQENLKEVEIPVEYPEGNQPLAQGSGQPEQVADLVYFLASEQSSHITGTEIYIDGAESLL